MNTIRRSNIILTGFMASGKSRIGEMLAKRMGYELIDIDNVIEREQGASIRSIFEDAGEWHFRKLEHAAIKNLSTIEHAIIVTGGGAPMCFDNMQALKNLGKIFFLDANLSLILRRLEHGKQRPLGSIAHQKDIETIKALYSYRRPIYQASGIAIDVNHENKTKTCDEIIERYKALLRIESVRKTRVDNIGYHYDIFHTPGAINHLANIRLSLGLSDHQPIIVTSDTLADVLKPTIENITQQLKTNVPVICIKDGEQNKNISSVHHIHQQLFVHAPSRKSFIIALGGGNVGDVAGFAASIYLRGIPIIQIPTTLLAMVDASIGGKTGIDLTQGKNLVGSFYDPKAVIIDADLLSTLAPDDMACGMAEIIKHAIIADPLLFYALQNNSLSWPEIIERSLQIKALVVLADPTEKNLRAHLNLGHTFAHAIERQSNYHIKHGMAVAMGLVQAVKLAKKLKLLEEDFSAHLLALLKHHGLPHELPAHLDKRDLIKAMYHDKKRDHHGLMFILPKKIGEVIIERVDEEDVLASLLS